MSKKILLVEPPYKALFPPLGLMKISTWHKRKGDNVDFIKHLPVQYRMGYFKSDSKINKYYKPHRKKYDIIYITSLFTYYSKEVIDTINYYKRLYPKSDIKVGGILASLMPELIEEKTGICPHQGLLDKRPKIEFCPPDYSLYPNLDYSISFTSRGCDNDCPFCAVKKHEPNFFIKENWIKDINLFFNKIIFWDNNWFQSRNMDSDIKNLLDLKKKNITNIDFNQGLDCRLYDLDMAKAIKDLPIKPLRFAFDNHSEEGKIQKAILLAQKFDHKDIRVYVLYNFNSPYDTPEYFYYRINEINKLGAMSYPMRYRPLDSLTNQSCYAYISNNWDQKLLRGLKLTLMFFYSKGMITHKRESFLKIYGNNKDEFISKMYEIYENDKLRGKERRNNEKT